MILDTLARLVQIWSLRSICEITIYWLIQIFPSGSIHPYNIHIQAVIGVCYYFPTMFSFYFPGGEKHEKRKLRKVFQFIKFKKCKSTKLHETMNLLI